VSGGQGHHAWHRLSRDAFAPDLAPSELYTNLDALKNSSVNDLAELYRAVLTDLLDRHCPIVRYGMSQSQAENAMV